MRRDSLKVFIEERKGKLVYHDKKTQEEKMPRFKGIIRNVTLSK